MTSDLLLADLRRDEGLRLRAYPDPLSGGEPWTIGYGHTGSDVHPSTVWTPEEAETSLEQDAAHACDLLDRYAHWWRFLDPVRQDAMATSASTWAGSPETESTAWGPSIIPWQRSNCTSGRKRTTAFSPAHGPRKSASAPNASPT